MSLKSVWKAINGSCEKDRIWYNGGVEAKWDKSGKGNGEICRRI